MRIPADQRSIELGHEIIRRVALGEKVSRGAWEFLGAYVRMLCTFALARDLPRIGRDRIADAVGEAVTDILSSRIWSRAVRREGWDAKATRSLIMRMAQRAAADSYGRKRTERTYDLAEIIRGTRDAPDAPGFRVQTNRAERNKT